MARYKRRRSRVVRLGDTLAPALPDPPAGARRPWHVVVLTDADARRLCTMMTQDVAVTVLRVRDPLTSGYAQEHGLTRLVLAEPYGCRHTAYARMMRIRGWPVAERKRLIEASNPAWADLAGGWGVPDDEGSTREEPTDRQAASAPKGAAA